MRLQVKNISKKFKAKSNYVGALDQVSLDVKSGEFICLLGPSGCGKSTLLNLIAGLEAPDQGEIYSRGKIGLMFQEAALFPWLKVKDNVGFGLKMQKVHRPEIAEQVDKYLSMMHLSAFAEAYPHELSGGMKQRAALARTLILNPDLLLMDEPFAALDAQTRERLYGDLQKIWQETKKTIIFVTHNVREAVCLGDRVEVFTARPGKIKKEFKINLSRPRNLNDVAVAQISNEIMQELKEEIDKVAAEMADYKKHQND
ncbi:MAG: nitrate/sulfonate/bicarbonate ABC transporter ATP-binding protein [Candidatus Kerfeldbacteria bacterium RIFOXYA2_FULL_38_24]|uniref:Nitrate/sulfonate/bicarbonate ABC transporter ATP-binding protein n=1 Tax=Candidatus Kerfeldbacteria bacterium RIFOXYB2_FULL_38_14 TaxID=1798547 RepID=A0A1G2BFX5_9BACT|nr:MAG: nitrate/sulfonate/bicarbonate ABC transporter ATP-binding protein [Candidatus Kerfeldbacteria bacterium RIFOXYA2_FULL_38_24]OGY88123.1 MAG: nitrate/sulfonate/bicarbonate ABC transporter ATP-binding protein [Candidatus Kerfeldbacteria bacterium RIFOXYB2_FULL_38_14]OGY89605.1 MAG: nitrate/sulfonate/bicarbonate ABC transporter ATP-binding protein [Candidatus Kerfeldbacteria bacterium RIFOXYC2_FULL_38_9]